ncbi:MAG: 3-hydroxyacyl-ACP dehydratase FabZ [Bdellovibrionales bacterium]|nr:3-hydroxyacyl-ACP dehydratase FabZ [Bdellovibrionales bacterium]
MDIEKIQKVLPHAYPFLLIDKVVGAEEGPNPPKRQGRKIHAIKCVTFNEPHFQGHFPVRSLMPGVLLIETIAQAGGLAYFLHDEGVGELMIASVLGAKFRKPVVPGDQLNIHVEVTRERKTMIVLSGYIEVDGEKVCEAEVMAFARSYPGSN